MQRAQEWLTQVRDDELERIFLRKTAPKKLPLPIAFDDTCKGKGCRTRMERMYCHYYVEPAPFATFQCPKCMLRLYLFEAPDTPFLMWSDNVMDPEEGNYPEQIRKLIAKRERHRQVRALRYGEATLLAGITRLFAILKNLRRRR